MTCSTWPVCLPLTLRVTLPGRGRCNYGAGRQGSLELLLRADYGHLTSRSESVHVRLREHDGPCDGVVIRDDPRHLPTAADSRDDAIAILDDAGPVCAGAGRSRHQEAADAAGPDRRHDK